MKPRNVFLFDDACDRCRRFAGLARALNLGGRVEFAALDSARGEALLPDLTRWDRLLTARFIDGAGRRFAGAEAVSELFAALSVTGWAWRPARVLVPGLQGIARAAYSRMAAPRGATS